MADRSIVTRLRAEVGQYLTEMDKAAKATDSVGNAGQTAASKLEKALSRQEAAAKSLVAAESRLADLRKSGSASNAQMASAEASVVRARQADVDATTALTAAMQDAKAAGGRGGLLDVAKQNEAEWTRAGAVFVGVGTAITAVGVSALRTGIAYNTLQQTSRAALTTLLGDAEAANAQMDRLDDFASNSPFAKQTFIMAQRQMLAFGIETQKVIPYLDAVQNAVAATGGSNVEIEAIVATMSKIQSSAKVTAEDLNEFGNRGVNAAELIGSQMDMTGAQVREAITAGTLDAGVALDALAAGMQERFDGAAAGVKGTFDGAMDRVKAAWRDLSSALAEPLVGTEGGGLLTGLLNEVADSMRALEDLPGPAKTAGVALAGLLAAGSLASGSFLLLAPRIRDTREAMATLRTDMPRTTTALSRLGRVAGVTFAALAAYQTIKSFVPESAVQSVEDFQAALLDISEMGPASGGGLDSLFEVENSNWSRLLLAKREIDGIRDAFGALQGARNMPLPLFDSEGDLARKAFEQADAALSEWVGSGNFKQAADGFRYIEQEALKAGFPLGELADLFPTYTAALQDNENQQRLAGDAASEMGEKVGASAEEIKAAEEALRDAQDAAEGSARGFVNLGESLNDSEVSLGGWLAELEANSKALRDFTENAATAAKRGLDDGLISSLQEAGPEGARRMAQLADATDDEIRRANIAWRKGEKAIADYVKATVDVPDALTTDIEVRGGPKAIETARAVRAALEKIPGLTKARIETYVDTYTPRNDPKPSLFPELEEADGGIIQRANGGLDVYGRSVPRVPQIRNAAQGAVMWGEPETGWEAYISGKPGMRERNKSIVSQAAGRLGMQVTAFANGGFVEAASPLELTRMQLRIRDLNKALQDWEKYKGPDGKERTRLVLRGLDRVEARQELAQARAEYRMISAANAEAKKRGMTARQYNAWRSSRNEILEQRREDQQQLRDARSDASSSFKGNASIGDFTTPEQVERALERKIAEMATFTQLLVELKRKGASPWLLEQLQQAGPSRGSIKLAQKYLTDAGALKAINAQAARLQGVSDVYGRVTASERWMQAGAWSGGLSAAQQRLLKVEVSSRDETSQARETARHVEHALSGLAVGAGV